MNRHNLELLFSWESFLIVPCKLLSLCLTLDVGGSHLRLREIGLIEAAVSRSIFRLLHEDASHRGSYDASLDSGLLTSFHGSESTSLGKGNLRGVGDIFQEWRGKMHRVIRTFDSVFDDSDDKMLGLSIAAPMAGNIRDGYENSALGF